MAVDSQVSCVTVFGGSGFLGREIVKRLTAEGITARAAMRHPDKASGDRRPARRGDVQAVYADVRDETSVALAIDGSDAVVNAVGLYVEKGAETFEAVHELGALNVAHQAAISGVGRLVHVSGIGADLQSDSSYVGARAKGELLVMDVFARATILRPSVLFGPDDKFLNTLAQIAYRTPVLPLFGRGRTRLQPVYVGDVAEAALRALQLPDAPGKTYELGGPRIYSYRGLIELVLSRIHRRRLLVPLPFPLWQTLAAFASLLPSPPLTRAQVTLMRHDNVVAKAALSLEDLGIEATALEDILPEYVTLDR
ncbi:complex I NDUFA9 subunit family protein [Pelagibius litoralis]|uniref:Complex I NDUFA9 subunit family protein n=1 Tax=Pelagibius litoralis TaxID=374515 RepID=A0A967F3J5_9PROT|nr:complex I NDUFA9 subunit family protein [Pelagibius litoralis]NIA72349.1 complex I NDUFA9 subunit family protein [Pelagibius litoralis]